MVLWENPRRLAVSDILRPRGAAAGLLGHVTLSHLLALWLADYICVLRSK